MKKIIPIFSPFLLLGSLLAHGVSESDKIGMVQGGLIDFFYLGAKHIKFTYLIKD